MCRSGPSATTRNTSRYLLYRQTAPRAQAALQPRPARRAGQRLVLYQRLHGSRPCARLVELEHAYLSARDRFAGGPNGKTPQGDGTARAPLR